jgi:hypothetical protein
MRELQRGARKDAMIPTGRSEAEEVGAIVGAKRWFSIPVEMVNTPSTVSRWLSPAPMISRNGNFRILNKATR